MGIGSGLGGQLTSIPEGTYGTYLAPTRGLEITDETLDYKVNHKTSFALGSGLIFARDTRDVITTTEGGGDIEAPIPSRGFGTYLNSLMGAVTGPVAGTNTTLTSGG